MEIANLRRSGLVKTPQCILLLVSRYPEGLKVTDISVMLGIGVPAVSTALDTLERRGQITRHFPTRDARCVNVYISPAGQRAVDKMWEAIQKVAAAAQMTEMR